MSNKPTGGPALPFASDCTLRDYFAAKAMQAMISTCPRLVDILQMEPDILSEMRTGCFAEGAYQMADAMLEARKS